MIFAAERERAGESGREGGRCSPSLQPPLHCVSVMEERQRDGGGRGGRHRQAKRLRIGEEAGAEDLEEGEEEDEEEDEEEGNSAGEEAARRRKSGEKVGGH